MADLFGSDELFSVFDEEAVPVPRQKRKKKSTPPQTKKIKTQAEAAGPVEDADENEGDDGLVSKPCQIICKHVYVYDVGCMMRL
jgi:hypothetical protein